MKVHDNDFLQGGQAALHDRHPPGVRRGRQAQGRRRRGGAGRHGRRGHRTARSCTGSASARPSRPTCSPTTRCWSWRSTRQYVAENFQSAMATSGEIALDDAAKLIGCWNGLAKNFGSGRPTRGRRPQPDARAVAFAKDIKASKQAAASFPVLVDRALQDDARRRRRPPAAGRGRARRRHHGRPRAQHAPGLAQGRRRPTTCAACSPTPAACPRASTCPRWTRSCS